MCPGMQQDQGTCMRNLLFGAGKEKTGLARLGKGLGKLGKGLAKLERGLARLGTSLGWLGKGLGKLGKSFRGTIPLNKDPIPFLP